MSAKCDSHISDESLEMYSLNRLSEAETEPLEEHLLLCSACQDRLQELDQYHKVVRVACRRLEEERLAPTSDSRALIGRLWHALNPAWAAAVAAAAVLLLVLAPWQRPAGPSHEVLLQTYRGVEAAESPRVPAGQSLVLKIDLTGLPTLVGYRVAVVDSQGESQWESTVQAEQGGLAVKVEKVLKAGRYWVRLYDSGSKGEFLREYALRLD